MDLGGDAHPLSLFLVATARRLVAGVATAIILNHFRFAKSSR